MSLALQHLVLPAPPGLTEQLLCLRRRWRLVLAGALLIPVVTLVAILAMPVNYTATGILLYDPDNAGIPGGAVSPVTDPENQDAVTASQSAVIASLPAARLLAQQFNFSDRAEYNPTLERTLWPWQARGAPDADGLAADARRGLGVAVQPGSRILAVSYTSTDPVLAAEAANLAMQIYLDHERDGSFAALSDAQNWLDAHSAALQTQLDATETALAQARAAAGVVQGAQASLTTETASRLAASLVEAQADLAMNRARLSAATGDAAAANAAIAPNLLPLRKEQADLAAQVDALQGEYGADYPALKAARVQLAAITGEISAETARELDAARAEVAADQAEISTLANALAAARVESQTEDADSAPVRALEQRADAGRDMLRAMTLQADELAQDASLTRPDARILSLAEVPTAPSTPRRSVILAAACSLGVCLGLLLAGLAEALDTSVRSGAFLRAQFGLPCLALIPEIKAPHLAALDAPFSLFAEQLRALRAGLGLGQQHRRIIAITAARPDEGKTTLTIALARALAASGLRTLAIDGDIRRPSFDPVFRASGAPGLTDYLAGLATLEDILLGDARSPLHIIPAGTQAQAALSLFLSPALPACLENLRRHYDVILIDVPPAFALAEGRVLARLADGALLCIRWGSTPRRVIIGAIAMLREAGVNIAGAALTRVNSRAHGNSGFADAEIYQPRYGSYFRSLSR